MSPGSARRLAVVTGAASGIGLATSLELMRQGTGLVGVDLSAPPPELAEAESVAWVVGDVSTEETWKRVQELCAELDPQGADCFIACAGTADSAPFLDTSIDQFQRHFEVNVLGVVRGLQALMPTMRRQRSGWIAVVASVDGQVVEDGASSYGASKAALLHVVRSAALEYAADGLRINAVAPGIVDTPMLRRLIDETDSPPDLIRRLEHRTPIGKMLTPEQVADVLCFLVSDAASGLSGATITLDGGLTTTFDFDVSTRLASPPRRA